MYDAWIEDAVFFTKSGLFVSRATAGAFSLVTQTMGGAAALGMSAKGSEPEDIAAIITRAVTAYGETRKDARLGQFSGTVAETMGQFAVMAITHGLLKKIPGGNKVATATMVAEGLSFGLAEGAGNYSQVYDLNVANGSTPEEAHKMGLEALAKSIPAGMLELLPIQRIFSKIPMSKAKHLL